MVTTIMTMVPGCKHDPVVGPHALPHRVDHLLRALDGLLLGGGGGGGCARPRAARPEDGAAEKVAEDEQSRLRS